MFKLKSDGTSIFKGMPRHVGEMTAAQKQQVINHYGLPHWVTSDAGILARKIDYLKRFEAYTLDEQDRQSRLVAGVVGLLATDPKKLRFYPPLVLYNMTGMIVARGEVMPHEDPMDLNTARYSTLRCSSPQEAIDYHEKWARDPLAKAAAVRGKIVHIDEAATAKAEAPPPALSAEDYGVYPDDNSGW